jgi:C-terminal processing protease CtpA/Prc
MIIATTVAFSVGCDTSSDPRILSVSQETNVIVLDPDEGFGIGVSVATNDGYYIRAVIGGSPAAKAGLLAGDQIVGIDGKSVVGRTFPQIIASIRGRSNSVLNLTIARDTSGGSNSNITLGIPRRYRSY